MNSAEMASQISGVSRPDGGYAPVRLAVFILLCALPFTLAWPLFQRLLALFLADDSYSHIPLIPVISLALILADRRSIFLQVSTCWKSGTTLLALAAMSLLVARLNPWQFSATNQLTLAVLGLVLAWMGAFRLVFGSEPFRAARFPLLFLLLAVPIPEPFRSDFVQMLQSGSTWATTAIFHVLGVPYFRQGFDISLPGITIEVAEECSSIRSTVALFILTVLVSGVGLRSSWKRLLICSLAVPISILKNGLRIAVLSMLAIYVNPDFLSGPLHKFGGFVFFAAAFLPLAFTFAYLRQSELTTPA